MKKPQLFELTLREKIGQMLAPHHWEVYGKTESEYDYKPVDIEDGKYCKRLAIATEYLK